MTPKTRTEQVELLRETIKASGLSAQKYAEEKLIRDPRTIRRWLAGKAPIPQAVLDFLTRGTE